jgi:hypothetical protein
MLIRSILAILLLAPALASAQIMLQEDFNDGSADGFEPGCPGWFVTAYGTYRMEASGNSVLCWSEIGNECWTDYRASLELCSLHSRNQLFAFRVQDSGDCYMVNVRPEPWNDYHLHKYVNGVQTTVATGPIQNAAEIWHSLLVYVIGNEIQVLFDSHKIIDYQDLDDPYLDGGIAVVSFTGGSAQHQVLEVDNILVETQVIPNTPSTLSGIKALYR